MCLIFFSIQNHPTYSLIVTSNRDEFYDRKTAEAGFWKDNPQVLGGRDLEAGGTWMGLTRSGKISLVTNYRDPKNINPQAPSRGHLVSDFLEKDIPAEAYMMEVERKGRSYNGFNLLAGSLDELWYCSNYRAGVETLKPGLYGLSNHLLDTPWPKVVRGKEKLSPILQKSKLDPEELFEFLYDDHRAPDALLPDTGIGPDREKALSSMFIKTTGYGSRCSTVVLVDKQKHVLFSERVFDLKTFVHTTRNFEFSINSNHRLDS